MIKANKERGKLRYKIGCGKRTDRKKTYLSVFEIKDGISDQKNAVETKSRTVKQKF